MQLIYLVAVVVLGAVAVSTAPNVWPRQMVMRFDGDPASKMIAANSGAFLPPRYRNLFGSESTKPHGSAFIPKTMSEFTGKVGALRRHTFSWRPESNFLQDI